MEYGKVTNLSRVLNMIAPNSLYWYPGLKELLVACPHPSECEGGSRLQDLGAGGEVLEATLGV